MNSSLNVSHTHSHHVVESCHHREESRTLIGVIEKISAIALGVFSAYTNWKLFIPFFFVGVCIGVYSYLQDKRASDHMHPGSSCAHGLLEQLTGVKLPPVISLAANIAVTICHIDHHADVFVPIVGVSLGSWLGETASHYGDFIFTKINLKCSDIRGHQARFGDL